MFTCAKCGADFSLTYIGFRPHSGMLCPVCCQAPEQVQIIDEAALPAIETRALCQCGKPLVKCVCNKRALVKYQNS